MTHDTAESKPSRTRETVKFILFVAVITLVLRITIVEAYHVPSGSMENTIMTGDTLLGNKFLYGILLPVINLRLPALRQPRSGDVIIFRHPVESGRLVKRVIAVAGQTVEIRNKQVFVDGEPFPFPETGQHSDPRLLPPEMSRRDNMAPVTVPEDRLWVMGDNREDSIDSRSWGFLDEDLILGKAMIVLYSFENVRHKPFWRRIRWNRFFHVLH